MSAITTHVLDTTRGRPARGIPVTLERRQAGGVWIRINRGETDRDGRLQLSAVSPPAAGVYRITFDTAAYFQDQDVESFYPGVSVLFEIRDPAQHHHVPLLLSPYGYSTYRGS